MSTPTPDAQEATPPVAVINWYFGPVAWDDRPAAMWHAGCPDPYATGRDGEVWLDHHQGAFCTGCRHYEPGQAEQDIPAERAAELPPQQPPAAAAPEAPQTTETPRGTADPVTADAASNAPATAEGTAAAASNAPAVPPAPDAAPAPGILQRIEHALDGHG